jgi:hypothetical protein
MKIPGGKFEGRMEALMSRAKRTKSTRTSVIIFRKAITISYCSFFFVLLERIRWDVVWLSTLERLTLSAHIGCVLSEYRFTNFRVVHIP